MTNAPAVQNPNIPRPCRAAYRKFLRDRRAYWQARQYLRDFVRQFPNLINGDDWKAANQTLRGAWDTLNASYNALLRCLGQNGVENPGAHVQEQPEVTAPPPEPATHGGDEGGGTAPAGDAALHVPAHPCGAVCSSKPSLCARHTTEDACYQHA